MADPIDPWDPDEALRYRTEFTSEDDLQVTFICTTYHKKFASHERISGPLTLEIAEWADEVYPRWILWKKAPNGAECVFFGEQFHLLGVEEDVPRLIYAGRLHGWEVHRA